MTDPNPTIVPTHQITAEDHAEMDYWRAAIKLADAQLNAEMAARAAVEAEAEAQRAARRPLRRLLRFLGIAK